MNFVFNPYSFVWTVWTLILLRNMFIDPALTLLATSHQLSSLREKMIAYVYTPNNDEEDLHANMLQVAAN